MTLQRAVAWSIAGLALAAGGVSVAVATGSTDDETPITGPALDRASSVALAYVGGGTVTGTEVGDEEGYYEVEVTRDGREIDVHLDANFTVIGSEEDAGEDGDRD
jgi:uncharacterized membrane protein YkoI